MRRFALALTLLIAAPALARAPETPSGAAPSASAPAAPEERGRKEGKRGRMADDPESLARLEAMRSMEGRLDELASGFDALSALDQQKQRSELEKLAGELFDLRQEQRRAHLEELEARLRELEEDIADRDARRDVLIDKWLDERLTTEPGL